MTHFAVFSRGDMCGIFSNGKRTIVTGVAKLGQSFKHTAYVAGFAIYDRMIAGEGKSGGKMIESG